MAQHALALVDPDARRLRSVLDTDELARPCEQRADVLREVPERVRGIAVGASSVDEEASVRHDAAAHEVHRRALHTRDLPLLQRNWSLVLLARSVLWKQAGQMGAVDAENRGGPLRGSPDTNVVVGEATVQQGASILDDPGVAGIEK